MFTVVLHINTYNHNDHVFLQQGRKDYVRREKDNKDNTYDNDAFSEHTNEVSFEKFDDDTSSNRSSRMSHKVATD